MDELKPMTIRIREVLRNRWHPSDSHRFLLRFTFMSQRLDAPAPEGISRGKYIIKGNPKSEVEPHRNG